MSCVSQGAKTQKQVSTRAGAVRACGIQPKISSSTMTMLPSRRLTLSRVLNLAATTPRLPLVAVLSAARPGADQGCSSGHQPPCCAILVRRTRRSRSGQVHFAAEHRSGPGVAASAGCSYPLIPPRGQRSSKAPATQPAQRLGNWVGQFPVRRSSLRAAVARLHVPSALRVGCERGGWACGTQVMAVASALVWAAVRLPPHCGARRRAGPRARQLQAPRNSPPGRPANWNPASRANMAPSGCSPTAWPLIRGASTLFSICWMARKNSSTQMTVGKGMKAINASVS